MKLALALLPGKMVSLDQGNSEIPLGNDCRYVHLRPGSHLHFQVMDGPSPYHLGAFELLSGNNKGKKTDALPMENMVVAFP